MCICMYIYIYICRERDAEREREGERENGLGLQDVQESVSQLVCGLPLATLVPIGVLDFRWAEQLRIR